MLKGKYLPTYSSIHYRESAHEFPMTNLVAVITVSYVIKCSLANTTPRTHSLTHTHTREHALAYTNTQIKATDDFQRY